MKQSRPTMSIKELNEMFASDKTDWVKLDAEVHKATISYIRSCARMGIKHSQQTKDQISISMKAYHAGKVKQSIS